MSSSLVNELWDKWIVHSVENYSRTNSFLKFKAKESKGFSLATFHSLSFPIRFHFSTQPLLSPIACSTFQSACGTIRISHFTISNPHQTPRTTSSLPLAFTLMRTTPSKLHCSLAASLIVDPYFRAPPPQIFIHQPQLVSRSPFSRTFLLYLSLILQFNSSHLRSTFFQEREWEMRNYFINNFIL